LTTNTSSLPHSCPPSSIFTSTLLNLHLHPPLPNFPTSSAPSAPFNATNFRFPSANFEDSGYGSSLGRNSSGFLTPSTTTTTLATPFTPLPPHLPVPLSLCPTSPSFPLPEVEDEMSELELSESESEESESKESAVSTLEYAQMTREKGGFTGVKGYWAMGLRFSHVV
jgi:hypothetical protein